MPKWIESQFPFARLSKIAEQESWRKEVYRPVYYIHKWWARRLGTVFRGIILGSCLDEREDFWQQYYGSNDFRQILLFDPFMGSGVTIGEAVKLGCRSMGRDINPVAVTACQAAFSRYDYREIDAAYREIESNVAPKLLKLFETRSEKGDPATVLYYFMVKVVGCPNCSATIDLFKSRIFSANAMPKKDPSARASCPACGAITHTRYDAEDASCSDCQQRFNPQTGTVSGPHVQCPHCDARFKLVDRMKDIDGPLAYRRYAKMILLQDGRKVYESMNEYDREMEKMVAEEYDSLVDGLPRVRVESGYNTDQMLKHNYRYWHELFSDRHILCIRQLADAIRALENPDIRRLFACLFSGTLEFNNLFASFKGEGTGAVRHMFANHVLKPELMPLEANIWGTTKSSGSFSSLYHSRIERALKYKANPTEVVIDSYSGAKAGGFNHPLSAPIAASYQEFQNNRDSVYISQGDSGCTDIPDGSVDVIVSDPPFFDNVHYSQLADFFYYWLNQVLNLSTRDTTRHQAEVQDTHASLFTSKLTSVFAECRRVLKSDGLFVFSYHHARHDGWTAVHRAIRHAGFVCKRAYPIKAEMSVSMPLQQAKSPIHLDLILLCRKSSEANMRDTTHDALHTAIETANAQVSMLKSAGIAVSLADAKVILMGQLLCEAHNFCCLDREEAFLERREQDVDSYVADVLSSKGEVLYTATESKQLMLFEEMATYLANKPLQRTQKSLRR